MGDGIARIGDDESAVLGGQGVGQQAGIPRAGQFHLASDGQHFPLEQLGQGDVGIEAEHRDPPAAQQKAGTGLQRGGVQQVGRVQQAFDLQRAELVDDVLPGTVGAERVVGVDVGVMLLLVRLFFPERLEELLPARKTQRLGKADHRRFGRVGGVGDLLQAVFDQGSLFVQDEGADALPGAAAVFHHHLLDFMDQTHSKTSGRCILFL